MSDERRPRGRPHSVSDQLRLRSDAIGIALSAMFERSNTITKQSVPKVANYLADPAAQLSVQTLSDGTAFPAFAPPLNSKPESLNSALRYTRSRLNGTSANKFGYTQEDEWTVRAGAELVLIVLTSTHALVAQTFAAGLLEQEWPPVVVGRLLELAKVWNARNPAYFDVSLAAHEIASIQRLLDRDA